MPLVRRGLLATVVLVAAACSPAPSPVPVPSAPAQASTARPSGTPGGPSVLRPSASAAGSPRPTIVASAPAGPFDPTGVVPVVRVVTGGLRSPLDVADAGRRERPDLRRRTGRSDPDRARRDPRRRARSSTSPTGSRVAASVACWGSPSIPATRPTRGSSSTTPTRPATRSSRRSGCRPATRTRPIRAARSILLHVTQPFANHNGGGIHFGPDGMLYIALGDGGSGGDPQGNGQRLDTLLAKILRIDVDGTSDASAYAIPPDNPFVATAGARPEIWLTGLRNPWRFSFDGPTGDLWIGDVGQAAWEEIDVAPAWCRRPELRLERHGRVPLLQAERRLRPDGPDPARRRVRPRPRLRGDRGRRRARRRARVAWTAATCSVMPARTTCG